MKVAILLFPGVEELDFVGFFEVLAIANRLAGQKHFDVSFVGTEGGPIECSGGMRVIPDFTMSELGDHDLLFVPGGGASKTTGVDLLMKNETVLNKLRESYGKGKRVWSACTGALLLGRAGLLEGKRAVTHHAYLTELKSGGAKITHRRVVTDGRITTGGGISSSIDVGLRLVEKELGKKATEMVGIRMEYPPSPTGLKREA